MKTWAVVVARTGLDAKSRLADAFPSRLDRARLARVMLDDVLAACAEVVPGATLVVTDTGAAWAIAWRRRARPLLDPGSGLNGAVAAGLRTARRAGAECVVVLPGDVPLVQPADLRELIAATGDQPRVAVVVPDHTGGGTNALCLRPPELLPTHFGPDSFRRHLAAAAAAGFATVRHANAHLRLDVDTAAELRLVLAATDGSASTTRRFLGQRALD